MKLGAFTKQPAEREVFEFSMVEALDVPDRLASAQLVVEPAGLLIDDFAVLSDAVRVWVSGGVAASEYWITAVITTTNGRILQDFVIVKVKNY